MKLIKMKCENCGATLDVNKSLERIVCNYCGAEIIIDDDATKLKRIEEAKLKARKDNFEQELKERNDLLEQELKEKKNKEELNAGEKFKKGIFSKILLIFFAFSILFFIGGSTLTEKVLAFIQSLLFIFSWLMGAQFIKEPFKGLRIILAICAFALVDPILSTDSTDSIETGKIVWDDIILNDVLPKPKGTTGIVVINTDSSLSIDIHKQSKEEYNNYMNECKKKGFTIDIERNGTSFDAYNKDGYKLSLDYREYSEEFDIDLETPLEAKDNAWTNTSLSNLLPKPKSVKGKVESDSSEYYTFCSADTTIEDMNSYVEELKISGFDNNHIKTEKSYIAENDSGYQVSVFYEGFNIMRISISVPSDK